jgi:predicted RNA-binding protein (virulence factor B family)
MKETFLVKHAVGGRAFIDTGKHPVPYEWKQQGEQWLFSVQIDRPELIAELLKWKDELNVFVFQEFENEPTRKLWFYVGDDAVQYTEDKGELTIVATSHISYIPDQFSAK